WPSRVIGGPGQGQPCGFLDRDERSGGGIGRRAGFRFLCPQGCVGSTPTRSTPVTDPGWNAIPDGDDVLAFIARLEGPEHAWVTGVGAVEGAEVAVARGAE